MSLVDMMTTPQPPLFSLLSQPCIALLEQTAPWWRSVLLRQFRRQFKAEAAEAWQVLDACGLKTLGDLSALSPLTLLALVSWKGAEPDEPASFWPALVRQAAESSRPLLRELLTALVSQTAVEGPLARARVDAVFEALPGSEQLETPASSQVLGSLERLLEMLIQHYMELGHIVSTRAGVAARRDLEIVLVRAGVRDGRLKTLAETGAIFHRTRERVRQVEERIAQRLNAPAMCRFTSALAGVVHWAVLAEGGVATVTQVARRIATHWDFGRLHAEMLTLLLARLAENVAIVDETVLLVAPLTPALMREVAATSIHILKRSPFSVPFETLVDEVLAAGGDRLKAVGRDYIAAMVPLTERVVIEAGECWLRSQSKIAMRIARSLRERGEAAHFTEIARQYNACFPDGKQYSAHRVHALLQCHSELFVRVGLGLYRVIEHQDERGLSLPSVLEQTLQRSNRPLHYTEVVALLKGRYRWTEATIRSGLANHPRLQKLGIGFFGISDHDHATFDSTKAYGHLFGVERASNENLVTSHFTNKSAHLVLQVRLTARLLVQNKLSVQAKALREMFPTVGKLIVEVVAFGQPARTLSIGRGVRNLTGLKNWLYQIHAAPDDFLLIERLGEPPEMAAPAYRFVYAPAGKLDEALQVVGLSPAQLVPTPRSGR